MLKVLQFVQQIRALITQASWDAVLKLIADFQAAVADGSITLGEWATIIGDAVSVWTGLAQSKIGQMTKFGEAADEGGGLVASVAASGDEAEAYALASQLEDQLTVAVRQEGGAN